MKSKILIATICLQSFGSISALSIVNLEKRTANNYSKEEFIATKEDKLAYKLKSKDMGIFNSLFKSKIQKLIEKAEKGDAISQYQLGMCYFEGTEVTQDYNKAIEWFRKAAKQDEANSIYNLGVCYSEGKGVAQNLDEAVKWFHKAAKLNVPEAMVYLGNYYISINKVQEGMKWLKISAEIGNAHAQYNLANNMQAAIFENYTDEEIFTLYYKAARQGHAKAQYKLGNCYIRGKGTAKNSAEAVKCFNSSAQQGCIEALYMLAWCFQNNEGVAQNLDEAIRLYQIIINSTHLHAINESDNLIVETQYNLGLCFHMKNDYTAALGYFINAAEKGHVDAQFNAGVIFYNGREDDKARYWLQKAADQGDNKAKQLLQEF